MYFDESFSYSYLILPFVKYPFTSVCYSDTSLSTAITMSSLSGFMFEFKSIFILAILHQIVVKSGTIFEVFLCVLTSFEESLLIDGMEVGTHVRWRAAISRNSDSDNEGLPFLRLFSLALLASSVKNLNQIAFLLFNKRLIVFTPVYLSSGFLLFLLFI